MQLATRTSDPWEQWIRRASVVQKGNHRLPTGPRHRGPLRSLQRPNLLMLFLHTGCMNLKFEPSVRSKSGPQRKIQCEAGVVYVGLACCQSWSYRSGACHAVLGGSRIMTAAAVAEVLPLWRSVTAWHMWIGLADLDLIPESSLA